MVRALAGDSTMTRGLAMGCPRDSAGGGANVKHASLRGVDPKHLLETFGTLGLLAIVFAETGLLVGFFLPGDSLLVLAGLFSAVDNPPVHLNLAVVLVALFIAAVAGAQTGDFI